MVNSVMESKTLSECGICHRRFSSVGEAESCEAIGIPAPRYRMDEKIQLSFRGFLHEGIITGFCFSYDDEDSDPHQVLCYKFNYSNGYNANGPGMPISEDDPDHSNRNAYYGIVGRMEKDGRITVPPVLGRVGSFEQFRKIFASKR